MPIAFQFLTAPPDAGLLYVGVHSPAWVTISILLAILGSYAALRASARCGQLQDPAARLAWASISALTMGAGVWAMHFIGMLALILPCRVNYDPLITLVSIVPGILAAGVALGVGWHGIKHLSPLVSSILLGTGIGTMHYTGMAAMRLEGFVRYDPFLFAMSILVAIGLSYVALRIKHGTARTTMRHDALVAVVLGGAVSGMHYTAMSAAYFVRGDVAELPSSVFTTDTLAVAVAVITAFLALGAMILAAFSRNREITDQLRESERQTRQLLTENETILSNALVGIVYLKQRTVVSCNRRLEEIFQYEPGELVGKSSELFYDTRETFDYVGRVAYQAVAEGRSYTSDLMLRHKDGSLFWGTVSGRAVDPARPHEGSIWIYSDITERKQAEEQLRIAATVFESQEGMLVTDADGVILRVNHAFTETTGYTAEEAVGQTPRLLQSGRHGKDFYRAMWESIHRTGGWQGEIWDRRKNGEEYPKWLTISAVKGSDGAVTHYVGTQFDISERKKAEDRINELAYYDQLTGLPNRTLLMDRLKQAMAASARSGSHGAVLLIDLDNFKTLNDTLGHDQGDLLLKQVAQRLTTCVRAGDTVARLGGDEFVVALADLGASGQEAAKRTEFVGEKILAALNQSYPLDTVAYYSTPSMGATLFKGDRTSIDDLLKQSDLAMYKAKDAGRNALRFFDPDMETAVMERAALESDLRQAVDKEQFVLHYQAQVVGTDHITGAEVLVRWQHPGRGMVSPAEFIPLAEETGLILPLGRWVLESACARLAAWAARTEMAHLTIAVNVSAHQFHERDFVDQVLSILRKTGANPQRLKLELTESLLVANLQEVIAKMSALKAEGVGFSLDDFGTGYSSLSYLKRLPLDQLKIDQSFVRDILSDANDAAIARTIVALAASLGLGVIAEGVETATQRDFLAASGCHTYQGYFFSRPLPLDGFEEFMRHAATSQRSISAHA